VDFRSHLPERQVEILTKVTPWAISRHLEWDKWICFHWWMNYILIEDSGHCIERTVTWRLYTRFTLEDYYCIRWSQYSFKCFYLLFMYWCFRIMFIIVFPIQIYPTFVKWLKWRGLWRAFYHAQSFSSE
jgi:hypothetical protein